MAKLYTPIRRILIAVALVGSGLMAVGLAASAALWIWLERSQGAPPPIARAEDGSPLSAALWTQRVAATFPPGVPETILVRRLGDEGFQISSSEHAAHYDWGNSFPCRYTVTVRWTAESGLITSTTGDQSNACM
jgi:hypothetical protein